MATKLRNSYNPTWYLALLNLQSSFFCGLKHISQLSKCFRGEENFDLLTNLVDLEELVKISGGDVLGDSDDLVVCLERIL